MIKMGHNSGVERMLENAEKRLAKEKNKEEPDRYCGGPLDPGAHEVTKMKDLKDELPGATMSFLYLFVGADDDVVTTTVNDWDINQLDRVFNKAFIYGEWQNRITKLIQIKSSDLDLLNGICGKFGIMASNETRQQALATANCLGKTFTLDWWEPTTHVAVNVRDTDGLTVYVLEGPRLTWKKKKATEFEVVDSATIGEKPIGLSSGYYTLGKYAERKKIV